MILTKNAKKATPMNKRDRFYAAISGLETDRVPVSLWMHFAAPYLSGDESAERHSEFFLHYDVDIAKAVSDYRRPLPAGLNQIQTVADFEKITKVSVSDPFFAEQINLLKGLRARLGEGWPIIDTFFDPIQLVLRRSGFSTMSLILDNPAKARPMIEAATESMIDYVRELKKIGIDGGFYSTRAAATKDCSQGFSDSEFNELMKPYDMAILTEMQGMVRLLHTCKSHLDLSRVDDYPYEVLSWADLDPTCPSMAQVRKANDKCLMGGINQARVIEQSIDEIKHNIDCAIAINKGRNFILSPGCTIGSNVPDHVLQTISNYAR